MFQEEARSRKILKAFANTHVICLPDHIDEDLQLTVSLVPITCGKWTGGQPGQGLTFCLEKLFQFDMEGDEGTPVKIDHFHMCLADGKSIFHSFYHPILRILNISADFDFQPYE